VTSIISGCMQLSEVLVVSTVAPLGSVLQVRVMSDGTALVTHPGSAIP